MKSLRALVVENDPKCVSIIEEVLLAMDHTCTVVDCLLDARRLVRAGKYDYMLLASLVPARSGGMPSVPNAHRVLHELSQSRNGDNEPVIVLLPPEDGYPEPTKRAAVRMAHGFMRRGAADFIDKPFPAAGRTLDRVIEKILRIDSNSLALCGPAKRAQDDRSKSAVASDGPRPPMPLAKMHLEVLEALAESPLRTVLQSGIVDLGGYSKHATRDCLRVLVKGGLVAQPHGARGGYAITPEGRRILEELRDKDGEGDAK